MKDEFLYAAGPAIRQEFVNSLYRRLSRPRRNLAPALGRISLNRRTFTYGVAAVIVAAIAVACAREIFKPRYVHVGDMWVLEVGRSYSYEILLPAMSEAEHPTALSRPPEPVSVSEAIEMLPYSLELPAWLPDEYLLSEDTVRAPAHPDWFFSLSWANERGDRLAFWSTAGLWAEIRAPSGAWKELQVGGRPAILVQGGFPRLPDMSMLWKPATDVPTPGPEPAIWRLEDRWDEQAGLGLTWQVVGATLHLQTYGPYLFLEDLVHVAESMEGS